MTPRSSPEPFPDSPAARRLRRGLAVRLFLTCWLVYALHFATNTVREIFPALSLGDHLSFDVSEYRGLHSDLFEIPGRGTFINNNPGASMLGAIPYALARPLIDRVVETVQRKRAASAARAPEYRTIYPLARRFHQRAYERGLDVKFALAAGVMQAFLMAPLSALAAVFMFLLCLRQGASPGMALALAFLYAFATPVFYRTAQLNHNLLVAHCALFAFGLLWRRESEPRGSGLVRPLAAGILAGWSVVLDYSGVVIVLGLGAYAFLRAWPAREQAESWREGSVFAAGALASVSVLIAYQWTAFGHPFYPAQHFMPPTRLSGEGYRGMTWPQADLLWKNAFGIRYGLFTSAPLLLLALVPSVGRSCREGVVSGREAIVCAGIAVAIFLLAASNQFARLQFNSGVRHTVPAVPFLFLLAANVFVRLPPLPAVAIGVVATGWSWCLAMARDVEQGLGVLEPLRQIAAGGFRLPWLTTLERMGYVAEGALEIPLLVGSAIAIGAIWLVGAGRPLGPPAEIDRRRLGRLLLGGALIAFGWLVPAGAVVSALVSDPGRSLAWGPDLFRALLAAHGLALILSAAAPGPARPAATEATASRAGGAHIPWLVLGSLGIVALALRLWRLESDLWFDEVTTLVKFVRPPLGDIVTSFPSQNQHMLYSVLAHLSVAAFGESVAALRLPAVLFGVASVGALFLLGRRLLGTVEAVIACSLMTVSYHHVWFSQNARGYTGLLFFAILSTWLWLEASPTTSRRLWLWYVVAVCLGMWVHVTFAFVVASHALVSVFLWRRGDPSFRAAIGAWILCGSLTLQLYALSLPEFLRVALHQVSLPSQWTAPSWVVGETLRSLSLGLGGLSVVLGAGLLAVAGWIGILRDDRPAAFALGLPVVLAATTMTVLGHNLWPRFFFFAAGFAILMVVHGAMTLPGLLVNPRTGTRLPEHMARIAGLASGGLLVAVSVLTLPRCYALPKQDFRGARAYVESRVAPGDGVVAVGLAGLAYSRYYAPDWSFARTRAELDELRRAHSTLWLVYTLPTHLKTYRPDVWEAVEEGFETVKVFRGSLHGGAIFVCRERQPQ
jgi:mannosyltransferase